MDEHTPADAPSVILSESDPEVIRMLFETYQDRVYSIALVFFKGNPETAKDVTQQVFMKLIARIGQFESRADFSTWLYRIVTNTCLAQHRALKRWVLFGSPSDAEKVTVSRSQSVEDEYSQLEISRVVQSAIQELKPKFRIVILLKYFDDLSYEELSAVLQVSMGTVASRLNRGHMMLARKLAHLRGALGSEV